MQEIAEKMNYEFSLIRVRHAAISLKKEKFETIQMMLQSDIKLSDEKESEMKTELVTLAESILTILT